MRFFFGYDSQPNVSRETLHAASRALNEVEGNSATSWEDLRIDGQLIITEVVKAIDLSEWAIFDVTTLNPNVLFEAGYAIARGRPIGLLVEKGAESAAVEFKRYGLLRNVGHFSWTDSASIHSYFASKSLEPPPRPLRESLLRRAEPQSDSSLFFVPAFHRSDPDSQVRKYVQRVSNQGVSVVTADPTEARLEPLEWYAAKAYSASAVLLHFESPRKTGHQLHNARLALIAGMAHGFGTNLLMVAEESYEVPLDYRDLLKRYSSGGEAARLTASWLDGLGFSRMKLGGRRRSHDLAVELKSLTFGEHVAENEVLDLPDYFIETAEYRSVLNSHLTVFAGRKGTGKSANLFMAASDLRSDPRSLVCVVRPAAYDFEGLAAVVTRHSDYLRTHTIEGVWKLLLLSEVARVLVERFSSRPPSVPLSDVEQALIDGTLSGPFDVQADFATRIDGAIRSLENLDFKELSLEQRRERLNEALHSEWIGRLRRLLAPIVSRYDRVAILIDNLDKGWERSADLPVLTDLLLGLLSAVGKVERELTRDAPVGSEKAAVTLAVFLRSDIFGYIKEKAREPDKISTAVVQWSDPTILRRVLEERYLAGQPEGTGPQRLWERFFCPDVGGVPTSDYIVSRILPRPRDLIYFCNAAIGIAVNRGHTRVEADDIIAAENDYSQFAFEAILVENGITIEDFEAVLLEFLGAPAVLSKNEVLEHIAGAGVVGMDVEKVFERMKAVSFIGLQVGADRFDFPEVGRQSEKADIMARKFAPSDGDTMCCVHPAYRRFLEIYDP